MRPKILDLSLVVLLSGALLGCGKDSPSSSAPQAPAAKATTADPVDKASVKQAANLPSSQCMDDCRSSQASCRRSSDAQTCSKQYLCCVSQCSGVSCR